MKTEKTGYSESIAEIESILEKFGTEEFDVDSLAAQVKRATELIKICKEKLRKAEEDVASILKEE